MAKNDYYIRNSNNTLDQLVDYELMGKRDPEDIDIFFEEYPHEIRTPLEIKQFAKAYHNRCKKWKS